MEHLPRLRKRSDRRTINILIDKVTDDIYRMAKENGYDAAEIARQAVTAEFIRLAAQLKVKLPLK